VPSTPSRRWVDKDPVAGTAAAREAARAALRKKFVDEVDPDRLLPEQEREELAAQARRLHYQRLALLSAAARRRYRAERMSP